MRTGMHARALILIHIHNISKAYKISDMWQVKCETVYTYGEDRRQTVNE